MCWDELAATRTVLPPHRAPGRQPPLFLGQPLILTGHHGIQGPHGWELLAVQLSSIVTLPASRPAQIDVSSLDIQVFPQITISIRTTSRELAQGQQLLSAYASLGYLHSCLGHYAC